MEPTHSSKVGIDVEGYLFKKSQYRGVWTQYYFCIDGVYSKSLHQYIDDKKRVLKLSLTINNNSTLTYIGKKDDQENVLQVRLGEKNNTIWYLSCTSKKKIEEWINVFHNVINSSKDNNDENYPDTVFSKRPILARGLNAVCTIPQLLKVGAWSEPNDIHAAIEKAKMNTSLKDLGGIDKGEKMIALYDKTRQLGLIRSGAEYTAGGHKIVLEGMVKNVTRRLKFFEYIDRHPTIHDVPIENPIFVVGFPRTGTTFLHEMLGLHPRVGVHYTWEQSDPIPNTQNEDKSVLQADRDKRYANGKGRFELMMQLGGDDIQSIHRVGYDESEECTTPCSLELPWYILDIPFNAFAAKEVMDMGAGDTFNIYRTYLKLLFWQSKERYDLPGFTWMLKCPFHLPYLTELYAAFPDATVVWTHRNPVECIASACSLYETLLHMCCIPESISRHALGKAVMEYTAEALDRAISSLSQLSASVKVVHLKYKEIIKQPVQCVTSVFNQANLTENIDVYHERLDVYLIKNKEEREAKKAKQGKMEVLHEYSLEDYGLSEAKVSERFSSYISNYCD